MFHRSLVVAVALVAALVVVSLSAAAPHHHARKTHRHPQRIVSLSPTITEDLFAIGAGKQVVAVDEDSTYPKRAPRTSLSGYTPNVEAIAGYHPDLVVVSYNPQNFVSQLRQLGIKVLMVPAAKGLQQTYRQILALGLRTGHPKSAHAVVRGMKTRLAALVRSVPRSRRHLRVYHELDQTYYSATSQTFIGSIYRLFGFKDIADAAGASAGTDYPQLSAEYIVHENPQIIVLADTKCCGQTPATVAARPGWGTIAAVQHHRVIGVDDDVASRWGPRIVHFARRIAEIAKSR